MSLTGHFCAWEQRGKTLEGPICTSHIASRRHKESFSSLSFHLCKHDSANPVTQPHTSESKTRSAHPAPNMTIMPTIINKPVAASSRTPLLHSLPPTYPRDSRSSRLLCSIPIWVLMEAYRAVPVRFLLSRYGICWCVRGSRYFFAKPGERYGLK